MSTDTPEPADAPPAIDHITLRRSEDGEVWLIRDEDTGVATQGDTREEALEMLDEAVAGYHGEGTPPTDEELREIGIDPANNESGSIEDSEIFE